ncbi:hypothetical protein bsdtb5_32880 [Anaeromicropila herbilytica]|uniref:Uncharacterized protein n=2 Tax=Anaeromicropila herbilytica TaxID=2785025 RepID=A0A7R7END7_9FIRM|nr:hypothetical protein bsdtb5_32880 [Anaeromicropila herbilytica]
MEENINNNPSSVNRNDDINNELNSDRNDTTSAESLDESQIKIASIPNQKNQKNQKNQRNQKNQNNQRGNNPFNRHGLDIFRTATPFLDSRSRRNVNMIIKMTELTESLREYNTPNDLSACSLGEDKIDTEGMLLEIKSVCTPKERDFIDLIINFMKAKNLYNTYQTIASASPSSASNQKNTSSNPFGFNDNSNMFEMLLSFMPPDQKNNFDTLSMLMSTMNLNT